MAFKFIALAALVAVANAGVLPAAAPLAYAPAAHLAYSAPVAVAAPLAKAVVAKAVDTEHDPHPQYSYAYDVHDSLTGDAKSQHESRDGDVVKGSYSLIEADGTRRTVDYVADPVNGFNAVVHKEPATVAAAPVAVKTVAAAPVVHAAPLTYAAHAPTFAYTAPVGHAPALAYNTHLAHSASHVYAAPVAKYATPVAHASPLTYAAHVAHAPAYAYAAPVAKYAAAPLAYAAPATTYIH